MEKNDVRIPDTIASKRITCVGNAAFQYCDIITSVVIPNSVTSIGDAAFFDCRSLSSITIPDSVTSIGYCAFDGCSGLTSITIPFVGQAKGSSMNDTFAYIFGNVPSSLKSVTITGGTSIDSNAFKNCNELTGITISNSVTSIGSSAFYGCTQLTRIGFGGTKAQWNAISKDKSWNSNTGKYTICCTDGNINKS